MRSNRGGLAAPAGTCFRPPGCADKLGSMNASHRTGPRVLWAVFALAVPACDPPGDKPPADRPAAQPQAAPAAAVKRAEVGKNIVLETQADTRRVRVAAVVCFREGAL